MKIIINCDPETTEAAIRIARQQLADNYGQPWQQRYNKPGWGWVFYDAPSDCRFFVRGIKNGISVTQARPATPVPGGSNDD